MPVTIAIVNEKGGSSKTMTSYALSSELALKRKKVLAIDLDPQGNLSYALTKIKNHSSHLTRSLFDFAFNFIDSPEKPLEVDKNIDLYCANKMLASVENEGENCIHALAEVIKSKSHKSIFHKYDYIIIDCMPAMTNIYLSAIRAADGAFVPLQPDSFNIHGLEQVTKSLITARKRYPNKVELLGVLMTAVEQQTNAARNAIQNVKSKYKNALLSTMIPKTTKAKDLIDETQVLHYRDLPRDHKFVVAYSKATNEFIKRSSVLKKSTRKKKTADVA